MENQSKQNITEPEEHLQVPSACPCIKQEYFYSRVHVTNYEELCQEGSANASTKSDQNKVDYSHTDTVALKQENVDPVRALGCTQVIYKFSVSTV